MSKPFGVAVIGLGFVGRVHLESLLRLGSAVQVRALVSTRPEQGKKIAAEYGVPKVVQDHRQIMDDPQIHAIHICTPNSLHAPATVDALRAGKHVLCEKPLALTSAEARSMVDLAASARLRNCICHNLRFYPLVQQMRSLIANGDLGEILVVQGTYSQDWLLLDTDWNWRIDPKDNGPSRTMADIGSHWCDMAEYITGQRITSLCADLQTFHKTRKRPRGPVETFSAKILAPQDYQEVPIDTEDFGAVVFRMGDRTRGCFTASQVAAGRKNHLQMEVYGTKAGLSWDSEFPNQLWMGQRNTPNPVLIKDPSLLTSAARPYADLPGGHAEGYGDTFKQIFRRFYHSVADPKAPAEYPQFADGLRQLKVLEAEMASSRQHSWVEIA